jgi:signal transduction histidine kinase/ActR/RegA family two-component response regulator
VTAAPLKDQLRHARAVNRMAREITGHADPEQIRQAMAEIIGETLDVDRALIYDIRFDQQLAIGLCEWLNPAAEGITPTIDTYPRSVFSGGAEHVRKTRRWMESHVDDVQPALQKDGSAEILHNTMAIASLLWFPFDFEEERFFVLVFNQVRYRRTWTDADMEFVGSVAELVSMAHLKIRLDAQRREREQRSEQLKRLEGLGLLAGGVAHDFNNLLTAILGNAGMAARKLPAASPLHAELSNIESAASTAAEMCKQLLTYAGHSGGRETLLDLNNIALDMLQILDVSLGDKTTLSKDFSPGELWVSGDRGQLQQVILNLLTNASDALTGGDGVITVRTGKTTREEAIAMGTRFSHTIPSGALPFLEIQDTGAGMDETTIAQIFEPFFTTKNAGHGIGLAAVHGICASHRAGISIRSKPGTGTTFTVVFPRAAVAPSSKDAELADGVAGARVLVVDDEEIIRVVCESALTMAGYRAATTGSGRRAVELCDASPSFDLVVLDLNMPGLNGRQTLTSLREVGHDFPVVMISAFDIDGIIEASDAPVSFLKKPFRPAELVAVVEGMLTTEPAAEAAKPAL